MTDPHDHLRMVIEEMAHPDPQHAAAFERLWAHHWRTAIREAREFNDRELLHAMLDTGHPVPADIARQLLGLKKNGKGAPAAIRGTPEDVVEWVRRAILGGHPYADGAAFAAVARQLGCSTSTVRNRYRECPPAVRKQIKRDVEEFHGLLENINRATTPEEKQKATEYLIERYDEAASSRG